MELWWLDPADWRRLLAEAGFDQIHSYGWIDPQPAHARGERFGVGGVHRVMVRGVG